MFDYFLYIEIFFPDLKKIFLYIEMSSYFLYMKNHFSQCINRGCIIRGFSLNGQKASKLFDNFLI